MAPQLQKRLRRTASAKQWLHTRFPILADKDESLMDVSYDAIGCLLEISHQPTPSWQEIGLLLEGRLGEIRHCPQTSSGAAVTLRVAPRNEAFPEKPVPLLPTSLIRV
jgi:hypothetical protein